MRISLDHRVDDWSAVSKHGQEYIYVFRMRTIRISLDHRVDDFPQIVAEISGPGNHRMQVPCSIFACWLRLYCEPHGRVHSDDECDKCFQIA